MTSAVSLNAKNAYPRPQISLSTTAKPVLQIKYVQSEEEFFALREDWNRLAEAAAPCVFFRHEWFSAAWAWLKSDVRLYLICIYRQSELIGLCPLVRRRTFRGGLSFWHLEFLAVPDTQRCDILCAPADAALIVESVARALHERQGEWDTGALAYLTIDALALTLPAVLQVKTLVLEAAGNPVVTINGSWDDYYRSRSRRLKKNNNLIANRLARAGKSEVIWLNTMLDENALEAVLQTVVHVSQNSWKGKTGFSLNYPGPQRFIRALSDEANKNNWLSLWLLTLNGKAIAMEYQLIYAGQVYALRADFDAAFEECSPGAYLNWQLLKGLFGCAAQKYYMGPGNNAYKLRWTDNKIPLQDLMIYSNNWRGRFAHAVEMYYRPLGRFLVKAFARRTSRNS